MQDSVKNSNEAGSKEQVLTHFSTAYDCKSDRAEGCVAGWAAVTPGPSAVTPYNQQQACQVKGLTVLQAKAYQSGFWKSILRAVGHL